MLEIKRGCGTRVPGGVYLVTDVVTDRWALPIDSFLFDPAWIPRDKKGEPYYPGAVGVQIVENPHHPSIMDVWDWIGEEHYPYFPDFWEEARRHGISRRISQGANFDLLTRGSQLIGFHSKGILVCNEKDYYELMSTKFCPGTGMDMCPKHEGYLEHNCVSSLWQLVDTETEDDDERLHDITIPRGEIIGQWPYSYTAAKYPLWLQKHKAKFMPAAMFHLPIHRIEVIKDKLEGRHELPVDILSKSITDLPVEVVEQ